MGEGNDQMLRVLLSMHLFGGEGTWCKSFPEGMLSKERSPPAPHSPLSPGWVPLERLPCHRGEETFKELRKHSLSLTKYGMSLTLHRATSTFINIYSDWFLFFSEFDLLADLIFVLTYQFPFLTSLSSSFFKKNSSCFISFPVILSLSQIGFSSFFPELHFML